MIHEFDRVVLLSRVPGAGLEPGDVGVVVHVYPDAAAYEVEVVALDGTTVAVFTFGAAELRAVRPREIARTRDVA